MLSLPAPALRGLPVSREWLRASCSVLQSNFMHPAQHGNWFTCPYVYNFIPIDPFFFILPLLGFLRMHSPANVQTRLQAFTGKSTSKGLSLGLHRQDSISPFNVSTEHLTSLTGIACPRRQVATRRVVSATTIASVPI